MAKLLKNSRGKNKITFKIPKFNGGNLKERRDLYYKKATVFIKRRPMASFFIALGILFLAIVANTLLTPKPKTAANTTVAKNVSVYKIGSAASVTYSAKIDKKGVIEIVAQTPGIVSAINVSEGQQVSKGNVLVSLSNNYQGGNALGVSREIAALQYQNIKDTYDTQKGIIDNQRAAADANHDNFDKLRDITNQGINNTQSSIDLNNDILSTLNSTLTNLQNTNVGGANDAMILATKEQISQFQAAVNQLNAAQKQAQYSVDTNNPPTHLADSAHDIAIKQLDLAQKALDLTRETSKLQLQLAQISEATMYPAAPFGATVEKIHVAIGQSVNPGAPLITLSSNTKNATAEVLVPYDTAKKVSQLQDSILHVGTKTFSLRPEYISAEEAGGQMSSVIYTLPDTAYSQVSDGQYIKVEIPIGYPDTISTIPYLPIDSVFQTQDGAFVYVASNNKALARHVDLGDVVGKNVAILNGLKKSDSVILDRNVIEGEKVKVTN